MAEHNTLTSGQLHEPKGVDTADAKQLYLSDGAGSGAWTGVGEVTADAHICTYLDPQSQSRTFSAGGLNTILPFNLSYSFTGNNFNWDNTAKEINYTGVRPILASVNASLTMKLVGTGSPTLKFYVQHYTAGAWTTVTKSLSARKFGNNDVGNCCIVCARHIDSGDKIRLAVESDAAETFEVLNINFTLIGSARSD